MPTIEQITGISNSQEFELTALDIFRRQSRECEPYRRYLELIGIESNEVKSLEEIPFLPISIFKSHRVYCDDCSEPEKVFTSSTTSGDTPSRHFVAHLSDYEHCFIAAYNRFYGTRPVYALLPCYLEREGSSLTYMVDKLVTKYGGGFYLNDYQKLLRDIETDPREKILLGVSYALWDLAEQHKIKMHNTIVMETGGMKGRREELPKDEFHSILQEAFGVESIHSEYGMAELMSQAYSDGKGIFTTPPWMRVVIRDVNDPFSTLAIGRTGGVNIIDLGNVNSCAFIQTDDLGQLTQEGHLMLLGRIDNSQTRGCNLLIQ